MLTRLSHDTWAYYRTVNTTIQATRRGCYIWRNYTKLSEIITDVSKVLEENCRGLHPSTVTALAWKERGNQRHIPAFPVTLQRFRNLLLHKLPTSSTDSDVSGKYVSPDTDNVSVFVVQCFDINKKSNFQAHVDAYLLWLSYIFRPLFGLLSGYFIKLLNTKSFLH